MADVAPWAGSVVAAALAAAGLSAPNRRLRSFAMAAALLAAAVLVAGDSWDDSRFRDIRESPALVAAALAAGAIVLVALAVLFRRRPLALSLLAIAALPFRVPIEAGGDSANLLLPLYAVIAAGVLAEVLDALRPSGDRGEGGDGGDGGAASGFTAAAARVLPAALGAFVVLYAIQGLWSEDLSHAIENIGFFLVPFAVLASLLRRVEWTPRLLAWILAIVVAEAALFSLVGFAEYGLRELIWNETIIEANEIHSYFRANSLFWDPNIFGRYLAVTIVVLTALMLWQRTPGRAAIAGGLAFAFLIALATTLSQSSLTAVLGGLAVLAGLRWSARWTAIACIAALVAVVIGLAAGDRLDFDISSEKSLDVQTSGRSELIRGGVELFADHPVAGLGSGAFEEDFQKRFRAGEEAAGTVSHTEPVTVLAEQGAIGFAAYLAVLVLAFAALANRIGPFSPGLRGGGGALAAPDGLALGAARVALIAALAAMFVHSLSYAAFFIDPITWVLLAIGLALARKPKEGPGPLHNAHV